MADRFDTATKTYRGARASRLAYLAILASTEVPARKGKYSSAARVPWWIIDLIRDEMHSDGMDWRTAAQERFRLALARKRAADPYRNPRDNKEDN